ncbi:MAG: hypothetical protein K8F34_11310 [Candidatus Kuenenia stuttgartiensis]|jgi:hypothetical protein|uniref:Uncharacterized protein n=1 Tax=Kuenenia stuttgartiensis TaxID=174633 RepID=A0A2C9CKB0_KUEST|nr:hypothetical protein [Candidatus Kuenenia stuttgartiensis]MBE7548964.1 hypothetical protein [Planctomycetia bacterium]MBZ0192263.1 hypothetical protein [Candidatus Kuenenia stuttgartiensis]MCF6153566.1 hypothetical protein [Candidatus Kuenenia stuttgartiensis]MCL4728215.1 hypothetical protein [Candidatus Kuenenia stuttgartiensis]SOH06349.1 hypothetical protein KSMBR1_3877 [Candidatus Kuenenia stuttgartiensis]
MPITKELENIRKFESVGFTHDQAEVLTETLEQSHVNGQQNLKDFLNIKFNEMDVKFNAMDVQFNALRNDMDVKFNAMDVKFNVLRNDVDVKIKDFRSDVDVKFKDLRNEIDFRFLETRNEIVNLEFRIRASHADLLMKIFAIVAGCTTIAVAVAKLF